MYYKATIQQWPINTILVIKCSPALLTPLNAAIYEDGGYYRLTQDKLHHFLTNYKLTLEPIQPATEIQQLLD